MRADRGKVRSPPCVPPARVAAGGQGQSRDLLYSRGFCALQTRVAEEGAAARLRGTALIMPAVVVIGGQWGDEGKGRIVDLIAQGASVVARYSAGNNAGHTVINDLGEVKLNVVPAGIFYA